MENEKMTNQDFYVRGIDVRKRLGNISPTTLWRMVKAGKLPAPIRLGSGTSVYKNSWIDKLLELDPGADLDAMAKKA